MKKILAFALFLCMLCTSALADTLVTNGGVSLDTGNLPNCSGEVFHISFYSELIQNNPEWEYSKATPIRSSAFSA